MQLASWPRYADNVVAHKTKYISLHTQKHTQFTQNIYNQVTLELDPLNCIYNFYVIPTLLSITYLAIDSNQMEQHI